MIDGWCPATTQLTFRFSNQDKLQCAWKVLSFLVENKLKFQKTVGRFSSKRITQTTNGVSDLFALSIFSHNLPERSDAHPAILGGGSSPSMARAINLKNL